MAGERFDFDQLPTLFGRAWVFGDGITAEQILPPEHAAGRVEGHHAMSALERDFAARLAPGDFLVAGLEFGAGAATTATARVLQAAGVAAVIGRSFGELFSRLATDVGLPALVVEETGAIKHGDRLRIDIEGHKIANLSSGDRYVIRNVDDATLELLRAGGRARYRTPGRS